MKILKKEDLYENFEKRGRGSREKGGGGNEIHAPCTCVIDHDILTLQRTIGLVLTHSSFH
jgi:hypothetical protein